MPQRFLSNAMTPDNLRQDEFDAHVNNGTLRLAFVGMSNAGKSYRSKVLKNEENFFWYDVDGEIQKELGFTEMGEISSWLGYPNTHTYPEREGLYLAAENKSTKINTIETGGKNLVFDTTGSVIYLHAGTLEWLTNDCLIVNLDVGDGAIDTMLQKFIKEPKPVIWNSFFTVQDGEPETGTILRCYPKLLADRLARYRSLAHITIPTKELFNKNGKETLSIIKSYLPK
jgi:shikimate kinase